MLIYIIRNLITGKCYIGQTRRTLAQRFYAHKKVAGKSNACKAISDAMVKHGVDNFSIELIRECASQEEMDRLEIQLIAEHGTFSPGGYNLTRGGGGKSGYKHSAESVEKMASSHRGKPLTEEHKRKVSASLIGNKYAVGYKHTDETKLMISKMFKGIKRPPFSQSHREKISASRIGMKPSDETRRKMSEAQIKRHEDVGPYTFNGEQKSIRQLAELAGCSCGAMGQRLRTKKWTPEQAVAFGASRTRSECSMIAAEKLREARSTRVLQEFA